MRYITVERAKALIKSIDDIAVAHGVDGGLIKSEGTDTREACVLAEAILEAVAADQKANRVPRPKTPAPPILSVAHDNDLPRK